MSLPITSSFAKVYTEYSGSLSGSDLTGPTKYVSFGATTLRRKFDRAVVPALWKELWVGLIVGIEPICRFNGPSTWDFSRDDSDIRSQFLTIGLCNSSGSVPNDLITGSVAPYATYVSNSVYSVSSVSSTTTWYTSSINSQFVAPTTFGGNAYANVVDYTSGITNMIIPAYDGNYKFFVARFIRTSVAAASTMSMTMTGYDITNERISETPMTGSTAMGEAFNRTTMTNAAPILSKNNSNVGSSIGLGIFDETLNGEFDEVFISWPSYTCPLKLALVATKVILA